MKNVCLQNTTHKSNLVNSSQVATEYMAGESTVDDWWNCEHTTFSVYNYNRGLNLHSSLLLSLMESQLRVYPVL